MSSRTSRPSKSGRNYDRESGMDRVRKTKTKKVVIESESEEDFSSEDETQVKVAKKKILKKDYKEDGRRPRPRAPSPPSSEDEDERLGTQKTTKQSGTANSSSAASAATPVAPHLALLSVMDKVGKINPVYHALNTFTVNFFVLFQLLDGLQSSMTGNTRINNYFGEYFSLGTRIYYAYLGYYQILRAKLAANVPLDAIERRVFRKLETTLPLESCPIAGNLIGWFEALGSYKPQDRIYNWAYPVVQSFGAAATLFSFENDAFFYPNIPVMVQFFRTLAHIPNNAQQYVNQSGYIVPVRNNNNAGVNWLGQNWELDQATASNQTLTGNFARPGLSIALPEQGSYLNTARLNAWKRLQLPNPIQTTHVRNLEQFLLCEGDATLNWLRTFRNWANAEAKFSRGAVNLSQISPTTGPNVLCISKYPARANAPDEITEPWINRDNNYLLDHSFESHTNSAAVTDPDIDRAHTYRHIINVDAVGTALPDGYAAMTGTVVGPLFRYQANDGTFTGNLRNRWKKEVTPEVMFDSDLADLVNLHIYSPMGEEPEPVRIA